MKKKISNFPLGKKRTYALIISFFIFSITTINAEVDITNLPPTPNLEKELVKTNYLLISILVLITLTIISYITYKIYLSKKLYNQNIINLDNYILNCRQSGYSDDSIKTALLKSNYPKPVIYKAFDNLKKK
jgi:magnesium-transporting ATPase (P-type)